MPLAGKPETREVVVNESNIKTEVYSQPCQTYKMKRFIKILNDQAGDYFRKTFDLTCLTGFCKASKALDQLVCLIYSKHS